MMTCTGGRGLMQSGSTSGLEKGTGTELLFLVPFIRKLRNFAKRTVLHRHRSMS